MGASSWLSRNRVEELAPKGRSYRGSLCFKNKGKT